MLPPPSCSTGINLSAGQGLNIQITASPGSSYLCHGLKYKNFLFLPGHLHYRWAVWEVQCSWHETNQTGQSQTEKGFAVVSDDISITIEWHLSATPLSRKPSKFTKCPTCVCLCICIWICLCICICLFVGQLKILMSCCLSPLVEWRVMVQI